MSSTVEQIKEKLGIADVISSYLKIEKSGSNFKAVCPFHNEKTPSFFISPSRNSYYCFGCGVKGDIFSFVEQFEGLDFKGALRVLAERAGVEIVQYRSDDAKKERSQKDRLYELMEYACLFYESEFKGNKEAQEYTKKRGLTPDSEKDFRIGYAPDDWRKLSAEMKKKNFTDAELVLAGLAKHPDDPSRQGGAEAGNPKGNIYDRFRDRIMFPISDTGGRVIAFSGRILHDKDAVGGKYINSPETPIFKKGSTLYGLDKAKFEIRKRDQAILVEGQMDLVLSHQAGFTNTVASSGTALSDSLVSDAEHGMLSGLGAVNALSKNLIIAFDADKAGMKAAGRAEKIGLSIGLNVKVAKLPKGLDPADTIREKGATEWKKIIDGAQHIVLFYLSVLDEHELSPHTRMRAIRDKILPYVVVMPSAVERVHFIREIHLKTGIPEEALAEDVIRLMSQEEKTPASSSPKVDVKSDTRGTRIEDRLLGVIFWQESLAEPVVNIEKLKKRLESVLGDERYKNLYEIEQGKKNDRIFEVELTYEKNEHLEKDIDELLNNLEEETLSKRLENLMAEIGKAEQKGDGEKALTYLKETQEITGRLNIIKSSRFSNQ